MYLVNLRSLNQSQNGLKFWKFGKFSTSLDCYMEHTKHCIIDWQHLTAIIMVILLLFLYLSLYYQTSFNYYYK